VRKEEEDNKGKKKKEEQCNTDSSAISLHDTAIATSTCCITFHELPGLCICSYEGTLNLSLYTNNTGAETHPAERQHIRARHPSAPPPPPVQPPGLKTVLHAGVWGFPLRLEDPKSRGDWLDLQFTQGDSLL